MTEILPDTHPYLVFGTMGNLRAYREFQRRRQLTDRGIVLQGERDYLPPGVTPSEFIEHYYHQRQAHPVAREPEASPPLDAKTLVSVLNSWKAIYPNMATGGSHQEVVHSWLINLPGWTVRQFLDAVEYYPASRDGGYPPNPGRLRAAWDERERKLQEQREDAYIVRNRKLQEPPRKLSADKVRFLVEDMKEQFQGAMARRARIVAALAQAGYDTDKRGDMDKIQAGLRWWGEQHGQPSAEQVVDYVKGLP